MKMYSLVIVYFIVKIMKLYIECIFIKINKLVGFRCFVLRGCI